MSHPTPIVVFSHLRWDFVFQRPQHIMTRLARLRPVIFIEESGQAGEPRWETRAENDGQLQICRAHLPESRWNHPLLQEMVRDHLEENGFLEPIHWLYTPAAWPLVRDLERSTLVYDCMDELSLFLNAPAELIALEKELLAKADMVFTGGPSLYRSKKRLHHHVHCFPSSVDESHFGRARQFLPEPADQASLPSPRLGFFGVIDERLDIALIAHLADAHPDWQIILVGPVVKIDPASLPQRPNIHYLGQKPYADLPSYLSGWDVCLLPFARNDATRFISPTKTLEYMAAGKMIVSTPITDVAEPYGDIVYLGSTPEEFTAACQQALDAPRSERSTRTRRMREVLGRTSWDSTVAAMLEHLQQLEKSEPVAAIRHPADPGDSDPPIVVIGAGPTGLSAAYHLGEEALLLERNDRVGGWCRSVADNGFTFDYAGHIMFSKDPYVHKMYKLLLGSNVHWQDREAWIYSKNVYTRYPFQGSLYGLPPEVIKECVMGAIEARYGSNGHRKPACDVNEVEDCCGDGVLESTALLGNDGHGNGAPKQDNFEEFIYRVWGAGIARHFAVPYNRKLWAVPLKEMETSWLGGRVPMPDLEEMIEGALKPSPKPMGPNARFGYPLRGGFQALMNGFLPLLKAQLRLNTSVTGISTQRRELTLSDGSRVRYEQLISTMPLKQLIRLIGQEAPARIHQAAAGLRHVSVRCVNLGNAPGGFGLTCEITYSPNKPLPCDGEALIQLCLRDCRRVGLIQDSDPIWTSNQVDLPCAYVVYDHHRAQNVLTLRQWLEERDIQLAGRYSEWEYYNSDHAFLAGKRAAEAVQSKEIITV